ncbi:replication initiation protein (plasmid) [Corynebacterium sp. 21KM1197]|nr:replication initiation protein [Corynebacterium sp. 21KM1197]
MPTTLPTVTAQTDETARCLPARRRPVNLLTRIETGICNVLGGDTAHTGRIMKNPCAAQRNHDTYWGEHQLAYSLYELAQALDTLNALPPWNDPRPRANFDIGHSVDIFDRTRRWSYRAIKHYWTDGITTWTEVIQAHATAANLNLEKENREPPNQEITQLSRSIAHWVWKRFPPKPSPPSSPHAAKIRRKRRSAAYSTWSNHA